MRARNGNGPDPREVRPAKTTYTQILEKARPQGNIVDLAPDRKAIATLTAKFALRGHTVHPGDEGDFLVSRWGMSRWCRDLAALRDFAVTVGALP